MRILVCGSRDWSDQLRVMQMLNRCDCKYGHFTLIHGHCKGADKLAGSYNADKLDNITIAVPARFKEQGRAAGPRRNTLMLEVGKPQLVLAFHDDLEHSKGTGNMVRQAREAGVPVVVITTKTPFNALASMLPEIPSA